MFCVVQRNPITSFPPNNFGIRSNQLLTCKLERYVDLNLALSHNIRAFRDQRDGEKRLGEKKIDSESTLRDEQNEGKEEIEGTDLENLISEEKKVEEKKKEVEKIVVEKSVENTKGKETLQNEIISRRLIRKIEEKGPIKKNKQEESIDFLLENPHFEYVEFLATIPKLKKIPNSEISKKVEKLLERQVQEWILSDSNLPAKRQRFSKQFQ